MFRIRVGFNAFSDPDFYLNLDPDPDPGSQNNADPDSESGQFCRHKKLDFDIKNKLYCCTVVNMYTTYLLGSKIILKSLKSGLFVYFGQYPCSWIRIQESQTNADPDPKTLTEIGGNCSATVHTQLFQVSKASKNKSKSAHDLAKDPSLASDVGGLTQVGHLMKICLFFLLKINGQLLVINLLGDFIHLPGR